MAFLRVDQKKSGRYIRIVQSFKQDGQSKHRTLYSLSKVEDYTPHQLENLAKKFTGKSLDDIAVVSLASLRNITMDMLW